MTTEELDTLKNKLAFYEAFHAKVFMSGFIPSATAYYIEERAKKKSGYNHNGERVHKDFTYTTIRDLSK